MRTTGNRSVVPAILAEAHVSEVILDHSAPVKPETDSLQVNVESWRELGAAQLSPNQTPNSQPWVHSDCFRTAVSGNWTWEEGWGLVLTSRIVLLLFSLAVVSDSLWPHGLQHTRLPCPSPSTGACSNSCPLSQWCYLTISSSASPFFFCLQSFPASRSFLISQLFTSDGQVLELQLQHQSIQNCIHSLYSPVLRMYLHP